MHICLVYQKEHTRKTNQREVKSQMKEVILRTENIRKTFVVGENVQNILNGIDLEVYKGDFTVVMGSSGSGKSTLLYTLSGMDSPSEGKIFFGNEEISRYSQDKLAVFRRNHCGFVFQQNCLIDSMSIMDNVLSAGFLVKQDKKALINRANELFDIVEVQPHTRVKMPNQISGGRAQRVGIVRALINNPELLFADEPTGALNSKTSIEVLDTFTSFNQRGQSIVMVTHDIQSALRGNRGARSGHNGKNTTALPWYFCKSSILLLRS